MIRILLVGMIGVLCVRIDHAALARLAGGGSVVTRDGQAALAPNNPPVMSAMDRDSMRMAFSALSAVAAVTV